MKTDRFSRSRNSPYYCHRAAQRVKLILKKLSDNGKVSLKLNPADANLSVNSLKLLINYGWMWLIDYDEDKERWTRLRQIYKVSVPVGETNVYVMPRYIDITFDEVTDIQMKETVIERVKNFIRRGPPNSVYSATPEEKLPEQEMEELKTLVSEHKNLRMAVKPDGSFRILKL